MKRKPTTRNKGAKKKGAVDGIQSRELREFIGKKGVGQGKIGLRMTVGYRCRRRRGTTKEVLRDLVLGGKSTVKSGAEYAERKKRQAIRYGVYNYLGRK